MISLSLRQTSAASIFEHSAEPFLAAVFSSWRPRRPWLYINYAI